MTVTKTFFGYMTAIGAATGIVLSVAPQAGSLMIKPYVWIILAVVLFEAGVFAIWRVGPGRLLSIEARLVGFVIGIVLMVAIPKLAGSPARFF